MQKKLNLHKRIREVELKEALDEPLTDIERAIVKGALLALLIKEEFPKKIIESKTQELIDDLQEISEKTICQDQRKKATKT